MVSFENGQWKIDDEGFLVSVGVMTPEYWIDPPRMNNQTKGPEGQTFYEWPAHMALKNWIDIDAFEEAFRTALKINNVEHDPEILNASFQYARAQVAERAARKAAN